MINIDIDILLDYIENRTDEICYQNVKENEALGKCNQDICGYNMEIVEIVIHSTLKAQLIQSLIYITNEIVAIKMKAISKTQMADQLHRLFRRYISYTIKGVYKYDKLHPFWGFLPFEQLVISELTRLGKFEELGSIQKVRNKEYGLNKGSYSFRQQDLGMQ
ncbi:MULTISPECIES: hypothetical protein [unclassified Saccharicrinis]|uniref:hypothetical protein n=1 Tax=unclassified Saccharicrinis TaxID=2646859 RepID=UPI003D34278B